MRIPQPTKRFVIDILKNCNLKCKFCYHLHTYDTWPEQTWDLDKCKQAIDEGCERGNGWMDITGGEPSIHPHIREIVEYAVSKGLKVCMITNGMISNDKLNSLIESGISEFLVSRHGLQGTHDFVTNHEGAYARQYNFLVHLKFLENTGLRFNCVINKFNQHELLHIAKELGKFKPKIVNFINMNPHHAWMDKSLETRDVIADLRIVKPELTKAIEHLESLGIGTNVRYYPMCGLPEKYWRCVCSDISVMFDPYEWDYETMPKTVDKYHQWGIETSKANEEKGEPCCDCDLQDICGGANKFWHKASNDEYGELLIAQKGLDVAKDDFYHYRGLNKLTLEI